MSEAIAITPQTGDDIVVVDADELKPNAWDAYIAATEEGTFFHREGWGRLVSAVYGYDDLSLAAIRGGRIVGVLPLIDVRAPLLGRSLVSTAFTVGGGPVGDDEDVVAALADRAAELGAFRKVNYVELRSNPSLDESWLEKTGVYSDFILPLPADEKENLSMIPRKRRAELRKAIKAAEGGALVVREASADEFYALYARGLRDHGTPIFAKRYLNTLVVTFAAETEILIAEHQGEAVAGLLSFYDRDRVLPYYIGALPEARPARAAEFLYWTVMRRAAERGCREFDFGRSKIGTGPWRFKKLWGAEPRALTYRCKLISADALPDVNPNNPKFAAFVSMWRRLPVPVANIVGPLISGNFP